MKWMEATALKKLRAAGGPTSPGPVLFEEELTSTVP
jgi:hypothetical protein